MNYNIMLVGLGPHSKRIYIKYLKKHNINLPLLVDLKSNEKEVMNYLKEVGFENTKVISLPDKYKDNETMPIAYHNKLLNMCKKYKITHIICSVEPKAHNMYLKFALQNNINILSDKPITVVKGMNEIDNINKVKDQFYDLLKLYEKSNCTCKIMCQRQYHKGYDFIKKLLKQIITKYNIPITYIDIYHCDGNWEMPHDLNKENHPYKYGYGKLFHSGFHFIDLLAELLKLNDYVEKNKQIVNGTLYGSVFLPNDEKEVFNSNDYKRIFNEDRVDGIYDSLDDINFNNYGEKNFYGQLNFTNHNNKLITTANLNLLHYGFSRRGWFKTRNFYKENGRIRHERINIQVGPLMNIQVHSYQSKEIRDRKNEIEETYTGGLEHFDIDIYRNVDLIGGKPFERIRLCDLYPEEISKNNFIGYNEFSREEFINHFLRNDSSKGDLKNYKLAMEILYSCSKILYNRSNGLSCLEKISIPERREEKNMKCIGIIKDEDLGFESKRFYRTRYRTGARGIVINSEGKIALFNKQNKNEYKLPGGGVDDGEDLKEAFKREILEETGCKVEIIQKLGTIEEHKSLDNFKQKSHVYVSKVVEEGNELYLTQKEQDEGGRLIWVKPEEGLKLIQECFDKIKPSKYENIYHSKFIVYRDREILQYYINNCL